MNQGGDMYQANDGKWYPSMSLPSIHRSYTDGAGQAMPQGWQQGPNGGYVGPNGQTSYGGQQQYGGGQQGNYYG